MAINAAAGKCAVAAGLGAGISVVRGEPAPLPTSPEEAAAQPESPLMEDGSLVLIEDVLDDEDDSAPSSP